MAAVNEMTAGWVAKVFTYFLFASWAAVARWGLSSGVLDMLNSRNESLSPCGPTADLLDIYRGCELRSQDRVIQPACDDNTIYTFYHTIMHHATTLGNFDDLDVFDQGTRSRYVIGTRRCLEGGRGGWFSRHGGGRREDRMEEKDANASQRDRGQARKRKRWW